MYGTMNIKLPILFSMKLFNSPRLLLCGEPAEINPPVYPYV